MSLTYIAHSYGVPAKKGGLIRYTGDPVRGPLFGEIVGAHGAYLVVRFHNEDMGRRIHPTWEVEYLAKASSIETKEQGCPQSS